MGYSNDIDTDYEWDERCEEVTFGDESTGSNHAGIQAARLGRVRETAGGGAAYQTTLQLWEIWAATLPAGVTPAPGDTLTDSGAVVWTIRTVEESRYPSKWRTTCVQQQ